LNILNMAMGWLQTIPAVLIALTFHEFCHGYTAYLLGDPTAKQSGRITLNPFRHIDPVGFICMIVARFGWAKPVPVNMYYFRKPKRDMAIVAFAGPLSNLLLGTLCVFIYFAIELYAPAWAFVSAYAVALLINAIGILLNLQIGLILSVFTVIIVTLTLVIFIVKLKKRKCGLCKACKNGGQKCLMQNQSTIE